MKKSAKDLSFFAAVEVEGELYFSAWLMNGIFKMDMETGKVMYVGRVEEEKVDENLHKYAYYYQNCIYFLPAVGNYIAKLDLVDEKISAIPLPEGGYCGKLNKFSDIIYIEQGLWLVPDVYGAILQFDFKTETIIKYENWPEHVYRKDAESLMFCAGVRVADYICMCPYESEYFVTFDLRSKTMEKWNWKYPKTAFCRMLLHENILWFLPEKDYACIVGYRLDEKNEFYIQTHEKAAEDIYALHVNAAIVKEYIILIPYESNYWLTLNTKTHQMNKFILEREKGNAESEYPEYQAVSYFKRGFIVTSGIHKFELCVWEDSYQSEEIVFEMDDKEKFCFWKDVVSSGGFYYSGINRSFIVDESEVDLEMFLGLVTSME